MSKFGVVCSVAILLLFTLTIVQCQETEDCADFCTEFYDPVCAQFHVRQRTFPNNCKLRAFNCKTGTDFVVVHAGECTITEIDLFSANASVFQ